MQRHSQGWEQARARALQGKHSVLLGAAAESFGAGDGLLLVRVDCDAARGPMGTILEAERRIAAALGEEADASSIDAAARRMLAGLRRHLLGEGETAPAKAEPLITALARLRRQHQGATALLLYALDSADEQSLAFLADLCGRGVVPVPLVLAFRSRAGDPPVVAAIRESDGDDAIIDCAPDSSDTVPEPALSALPAPTRRVLRAAATVGVAFDGALLALLLDTEVLDVLEELQLARDLGVPIEDRGGARFALPATTFERLRRDTLPSLASAWHRRLASLLAQTAPERDAARRDREARRGRPRDSRPGYDVPPPRASSPGDFGAPALRKPTGPIPEPRGSQPGRDALEPVVPRPPGLPTGFGERELPSDLFEVPTPQAPVVRGIPSVPPLEQFLAPLTPSESRRPEKLTAPDDGQRSRWLLKEAPRAADHAAAAGDIDTAAELLVRAAGEHAGRGLPQQAHELASRALRLLGEVPVNRARRRFSARALFELGRSQAAMPEDSPEYRLTTAVGTLESALVLARELEDPELAAEIGQAVAAACYDIGSPEALERALGELTAAGRALLAAGKSLEAARLLNDEAAVWVRLGDPVRAHHLLQKSREVFVRLVDRHPAARREIAETEHLLGRLVLHVRPRRGREIDAADVALRHARAAAETYQELGDSRELARVWETVGRLELLAGRSEAATTELTHAIELQRKLGDVVGLARSTAAFADVMVARGEIGRGLRALADSIAFNREKGARLGLAHNRAALQQLRGAVGAPEAEIDALLSELAAIEAELTGSPSRH